MSETFDQFSKNYNLLSDKAISVSGYDTKTLVDTKLKKLKMALKYQLSGMDG